MGCVTSRIDKEERVRICKERKRLIKQLLEYRREFADAQLAYLRALRNTGVTLGQLTESESLEIEETTSGFEFPPSPPPPPPPLPPSPPPPPAFSSDSRKFEDKLLQAQPAAVEEIIEIDEDSSHIPPPPLTSSSWDYWDPFGSPSAQRDQKNETGEQVEEENWADTLSEFMDEDEEVDASSDRDNLIPTELQIVELVDNNSSMMSWHTKDTAEDMAMVVWRSKKTLNGVVKDIDEYFLKASAVVKDIAVLIDINVGGTFLYQNAKENKKQRTNSARVFSSLTWSWSSKSIQSRRETGVTSGSGEPCKPGAHCITLEKLYSEEQKIYKDVKEEVVSKVEHRRKSLLLQRQEEDHDWAKTEKTRSTVDSLKSHILSLQESTRRSYSTILKLINEELHPQLIALASGLMHMWQTMLNCHQVQNHISRQLNNLIDQQRMEPTTEYHLQAAAQLQIEVASWHHSFCKLDKYQREYARALCKWTELTDCLVNIDNSPGGKSSTVHALTQEWMQGLDKLPDKKVSVSEAIRSLLTAVNSIVLQQQEECSMRKRSDKLGRKLERELNLLSGVEIKFEGSFSLGDTNSVLTPKHPLVIRRAKVEALKRIVDDERAKYDNFVKMTRAMILNNLKTSLPKVFQALMVYSSAYVQSLEKILDSAMNSAGEVM